MRKNYILYASIILCFAIFGALAPINKVKAEETERIPVSSDTEYKQGEAAAMPDETGAAEDLLIAPAPEEDSLIAPAPESNIEAQDIASSQTSDADDAEAQSLVDRDENITAEDLGVEDPLVLPDSKVFYPLKNMWRGFLTGVTLSSVKKAQLRIRFANEKLIEAKKLAERTDNPEIIEKALDSYSQEIEQMQNRLEKIKEKAEKNEKIDQLVEKIADSQIKHSILIDKIEKNLPENVFEKVSEKIEEARIQIIDKMIEKNLKLADPEKVREKLENAIESQNGSDFAQFRNMEILKRIENAAPEEAKEALSQAREQAKEKLEQKLLEIPEEKRQMFKNYVKNMAGSALGHFESIQEIESDEIPGNVRDIIEQAKQKSIQNIEEQIEKSQIRKERIINILENGTMENMRALDDLENNLSPEAANKIIEVKIAAVENFKEKIENAGTEEKKKILDTMEKFHDARQLEILKQIKQSIPEGEKEFLEKLEEKAKTELQKDLERAKDIRQKTIILSKLAGDNPEQIENIKEYFLDKEMAEDLTKEQAKKIERKIGNIGNSERLETFKIQIEKNADIKSVIQENHPEIMEKISYYQDQLKENVTESSVKTQIQKVLQEFSSIEKELSDLPENSDKTKLQKLLSEAKENLDAAQKALDSENPLKSFGYSTSAMQKINELVKILKNMETETDSAASTEKTGIANPASTCAQVITPAKNAKTGECKDFPTPCDIPAGWIQVEKCGEKPAAQIREKIQNRIEENTNNKLETN